MDSIGQLRRNTHRHCLWESWPASYNAKQDVQSIGFAIWESMTKTPANVFELPLEERAEMALKAAIEKVIGEHAHEGLPIYIWRDGKVVEMSLKELREHATRIRFE